MANSETMHSNVSRCMHDNIQNSLLSPLTLGPFHLSHRVVLAPVTRCRALNFVPQKAHVTYYAQRSTPGGFLITEAVAICPQGIGFPHSPGIFTQGHIDAWKPVVDAVHQRGGTIFCQLWHVGRASHNFYQPDGAPPVSSTNRPVPREWLVKLPEGEQDVYSEPRALTTQEIPYIIEQFKIAARNARLAGFDGVEIHGAHGYLIDQFLKDGINDRSDGYGGSIENRCKFGLEVISSVAQEIGASRTGVRISPVIDHLGAHDSNPIDLGLYLVAQLNELNLAYLHLTEPRFTAQGVKEHASNQNCWVFRNAFRGIIMSSGGYTRESGMEAIKSGYADLIAYGRLFISNPDLPIRFALNKGLTNYNRHTFYTHDQVKGYTDYKPIDLCEEQAKEEAKELKHFGSFGRLYNGELNNHTFSIQSKNLVMSPRASSMMEDTPRSPVVVIDDTPRVQIYNVDTSILVMACFGFKLPKEHL